MSTDAEKGKYKSPDGSKTWEYLAIFTCSIFALCIGSVVGWNAPSVVKLTAPDSPVPMTHSAVSSLVAVVAVGHMFAPFINNLIVDRLGRKTTIIVTALPLVISWTLIMVAHNVMVLYVARFISGLSLGACICVSPIYLGEVSSADTRGAAGALSGIMFNLGIFFSFIVVPYLSIPSMAGVGLLISVCFVGAFWFMPESPYYLMMRGRKDEAEEVLEKLRGKTDVSEELETIASSLSKELEGTGKKKSVKDIFTDRASCRAFFIILLFTVMQHFGGFFMVLTFGQMIFKETGGALSDHTANMFVGAVQLISSVITTFLVDSLGRRPLIMVSGFVAGLCNLIIGVFFFSKEYLYLDVTAYSLTPFIASMVQVFAFNCGLVSLQIILMSEVFATEIKAVSTSLLGIIGGVLATASVKLYIAIAITWNCGHSPAFLAFFLVMWICTALILYLTPETKGKTFAEIQKELKK